MGRKRYTAEQIIRLLRQSEVLSSEGSNVPEICREMGVITKTLAREMLRKIEQRIKLGEYDMLDAHIPTFNEFASEYLVHGKEIIKKRSW